jgi:hypothetical protein
MAWANSEHAREAETAAREAAREADEAALPVFVWVVRDPTPEGFSDMTTIAVQAIESVGWQLEHMTSRGGDGDAITIHTLLFRRSATPA